MLRSFFARQESQDLFGWEEGQGLVEYALIIALVAIALVGALTLMGDPVNGLYGGIIDTITNLDIGS